MAAHAVTRTTLGHAYCLTKSWQTPTGTDSPHFPSNVNGSSPLTSSARCNLTNRIFSDIHSLDNLRAQSFIVLTSQILVALASILIFFPVLRQLPQATGQVIHRERAVHWGSTAGHYQDACSNNLITSSLSVDTRWIKICLHLPHYAVS